MTKKQRAQVVELLRCTAGLGLQGEACPLSAAASYLDADEAVTSAADFAALQFSSPIDHSDDNGHWRALGVDCLEAAQRLEEGWTP